MELSLANRFVDDLSACIGGTVVEGRAFHVMATLGGGKMLARTYQSIALFDRAVTCLA